MVFICTGIPDTFYNRIGFNTYKNCYGDLVDEVDELVMYGSQIIWAMSSSIHLVPIPKLSTPFHAYIIENNNKYSIAKRGDASDY